jgi:hypothetical protein
VDPSFQILALVLLAAALAIVAFGAATFLLV